MSDETLMDIVVQTVLFFELSAEETVDEDAAVQMLEQIAAALQTLDSSAKARFVEVTRRHAQHADSDIERDALKQLPERLGLLDL